MTSAVVRRLVFPVALAVCVCAGCSPESPQTGEAGKTAPASPPPAGAPASPQSQSSPFNHPPAVRLATITPNPLVLSGPVGVLVEADDPERDAVTFRYQWLVNDRPVEGQHDATLAPELLKRGDQVAVEVIPNDGHVDGAAYQTAPVTVANTPPEVTQLVLTPAQVKPGDRLLAQPSGVDADGDSISYTFKWWRNKQPLSEGESNTLSTSGFARGDEIIVLAIPHDAAGPGKSKYSEPLPLGNTPPKITSAPATAITDGHYGYSVTASDSDGDTLTYKLESAPSGMTIDEATGRIEWTITAQTKGTHHVRVLVEDGQGGHAYQEFDLSL